MGSKILSYLLHGHRTLLLNVWVMDHAA